MAILQARVLRRPLVAKSLGVSITLLICPLPSYVVHSFSVATHSCPFLFVGVANAPCRQSVGWRGRQGRVRFPLEVLSVVRPRL